MIDLTNKEELKKLDPKNVYGSTGMLADQCRQIWDASKQLSDLQDFRGVENIVISGMGGSAYGGYVITSLYKDQLYIPIYSNNDYTLPAFVNDKSLVILSSYSGSTEETIASAYNATKKRAKMIGLTAGGKLAEVLRANNAPLLQFDPKYNPSGQPRLGTGYMVLGMIALLSRLGFLTIQDTEVDSAISFLRNAQPTVEKEAQILAQKLFGYIPVIFAAEYYEGNAHIMRNQFNETAKSFSAYSPLPELNHHLMEGLKNPPDKKLMVLLIESNLYSDVLKKRFLLTKDVVEKNGVQTATFHPNGESTLSEMLTILSFGAYITLFLAFLYGQDPSVIPWVDYFKEKLKQI